MIVRREAPGDVAAVRAVQVAAFQRPGVTDEPIEAGLLDALRECDGWLPALSIVAEIDGVVVGHVVTTRGFIDDVPALGLGPIGVLPSLQRAGIGHTLMHATIGAAEALDESVIALLGSPDYYRRYGFVPSQSVSVTPPDPAWGDAFQIRLLTAYRPSITGQFRYASPFDDL